MDLVKRDKDKTIDTKRKSNVKVLDEETYEQVSKNLMYIEVHSSHLKTFQTITYDCFLLKSLAKMNFINAFLPQCFCKRILDIDFDCFSN